MGRHVKIRVRKDRGLLHQENKGHDGNPVLIHCSRHSVRAGCDDESWARCGSVLLRAVATAGRGEGILLLSREILRRVHRMLLSVEVTVGAAGGTEPDASHQQTPSCQYPGAGGGGEEEEQQQQRAGCVCCQRGSEPGFRGRGSTSEGVFTWRCGLAGVGARRYAQITAGCHSLLWRTEETMIWRGRRLAANHTTFRDGTPCGRCRPGYYPPPPLNTQYSINTLGATEAVSAAGVVQRCTGPAGSLARKVPVPSFVYGTLWRGFTRFDIHLISCPYMRNINTSLLDPRTPYSVRHVHETAPL